jgi:hypothetical protein
MKTVIRVLLLAVLVGTPSMLAAQSAPEVTPRDAGTHIGERAMICGHVQSASHIEGRGGAPTVMRVGGTYPYERINVVILGENRGKFPPSPEEAFRGKDICVTGTIDFYDGSASIEVAGPDQVEVKQES